MMRAILRLHDHSRLARAFALACSLLLLVGLVLVGAHQHERSNVSHPCAICSLGAAPAMAPTVVAGNAPAPRVERMLVERVLAPHVAVTIAAANRGPPSA